MSEQSYFEGFAAKAAEYGIDPQDLAKAAGLWGKKKPAETPQQIAARQKREKFERDARQRKAQFSQSLGLTGTGHLRGRKR